MTSVAFQVDQLFFQVPGGIGTYVRSLGPALLRQDPSLELTLFHARFDPGAPPPERWMRELWVEELPGSIRALYPRWALTGRPPLTASVRSKQILHATNHASIPPAAEGQKLVVSVHDLAFEYFPGLFPRSWRWLYKAGLRAAVRRADAIITPSRNTAEDVLTRTRVDPEKLFVVPLAASLPPGDSDPVPALTRLKIRTPFVLSVGTLEPRKNLVRLVRAYRRLAARGLPHALVLAGPLGWHHDSLMREVALRGPGEIVLTGPLTDADLDALYRSASAFAYPSLYEGFGLPVLEAIARGVPTVASNTSSVPEVYGDAAIGVDPRSVREIADALERILSNTELSEWLGERGRRRAERFTWDETARQTLEVYELLLGAK